MKYFSMFSGIGGFELGIQRTHDHSSQFTQRDTVLQDSHDNTNELERYTVPVCVGYSEIDKYAISTYERQYEHTNYGNATDINPTDLSDFDLLVGGFPCQAFSVAGKRRGFNEARGTLFFDIARILKDKRPGHLVLENVKGLLSHDTGKTFQTILGVLTDLGYIVEWQLLNSKDFGVPQNRERIFIVGHLGDRCTGKIFPLTRTHRSDSREDTATDSLRHRLSKISATIRATHHKSGDNQPVILHNVYGGFQETKARIFRNNSPTIRTPQGGGQLPMVVDYKQMNSKTRRGRIKGGYTGALDHDVQQGVMSQARIRRLTPVECERLQGFPDNWTIGSDTQRYKQCGNAVTVNVVEAVISSLIPCLTKPKGD